MKLSIDSTRTKGIFLTAGFEQSVSVLDISKASQNDPSGVILNSLPTSDNVSCVKTFSNNSGERTVFGTFDGKVHFVQHP